MFVLHDWRFPAPSHCRGREENVNISLFLQTNLLNEGLKTLIFDIKINKYRKFGDIDYQVNQVMWSYKLETT